MVYEALVRRAHELSSRSLAILPEKSAWEAELPARRQAWRDMLGLPDTPPGDLKVTVTGTLDCGDHRLEMLHYQPVPEVRTPANLYLPKAPGPHPGVVYVCGHASSGKAWYQKHARWFARHGYACLIVDTIEIGEGVGTHHGTYSHGYWHWYSQGYSPAGIEVWAAMRAADLLQARSEVDGSRLGITGNSGGGSIAWFTGAADERFTVVAPFCQTGTMEQHIRQRTIDGHCDCATWVNHLRWDLTDIGALIAPRALFVGSATEDTIWRPWSNREILLRLRRLYRLLGVEERVAFAEDLVPHGYSPPTLAGLHAWFEHHLHGRPAPEEPGDDGVDLSPQELAVFADGPPESDRIREVHRWFIRLPEPPVIRTRPDLEAHRERALATLRELTFAGIPAARETPCYEAEPRGMSGSRRYTELKFETEPGLPLKVWLNQPEGRPTGPVLLAATRYDAQLTCLGQGTGMGGVATATAAVEVRGTGDTSVGPGLLWSLRRMYPLLGESLPERQTLDLLRGLDVLRALPGLGPFAVYGTGETAALAIYAAVLDPAIGEVVLEHPVATHWDGGPEFCHALKVGDLPQNLALVFPRPITFIGELPAAYAWTREAYAAAGLAEAVRVVPTLAEWAPARTVAPSQPGA